MEDKVKDTVRQTFERYLEEKGHRKTQERFAILDAIYSMEGHFTMESLYDMMGEKKFPVSRATLYNTIDLLLDAHLVIRHQFGTCSQYEKTYNVNTHYHRVCLVCGKVAEFRDEALKQMIENTKTRGFKVSQSALYLYGICSKCAAVIRRKEKSKVKNK